MALPVKALKAGQESYWLDQIAKNREEYFSGKGELPGRFVGEAAATSGLVGEATPEQVHAMFRGLDPATNAERCTPLLRADPRSKLPAAPLLAALKARAAEQHIQELERLAGSKALANDVRSVQAACKLGASKRIKVETAERVCRKVLGVDPHELYGEAFDQAWTHRGKRVDARVAALDHCFSSPKSVSLLAGAGGEPVRRQVQAARAEALATAIGYLERHGIGVRRDHNGTDRHPAQGGVLGIAFEHRVSRAGDPQYHTHVLVQNAAKGPDGRWTAVDSDRLYAHLMAADHLYLAAERAALTERLGVRWTAVDERSGAAEIVGWTTGHSSSGSPSARPRSTTGWPSTAWRASRPPVRRRSPPARPRTTPKTSTASTSGGPGNWPTPASGSASSARRLGVGGAGWPRPRRSSGRLASWPGRTG